MLFLTPIKYSPSGLGNLGRSIAKNDACRVHLQERAAFAAKSPYELFILIIRSRFVITSLQSKPTKFCETMGVHGVFDIRQLVFVIKRKIAMNNVFLVKVVERNNGQHWSKTTI